MGGGLFPCVAAVDEHGRSAVRQRTAVVGVDAKDAEAVAHARGRRQGVALGGGIAQPVPAAGETAEGLPAGVRLFARAPQAHAVRELSPVGRSDWQWRDRGGVQDGVYATAEAVRDALEEGGGPDDPDAANRLAQWRL